MFKEKTSDLAGRSVCVLVPAYDGRLPVDFLVSYIETERLLYQHGVNIRSEFRVGCALIEKARNELVWLGMKSKATDFLLIDSDIAWKAEDVLRLLVYAREGEKRRMVCGMYCTKDDDPTFHVVLDQKEDKTIIQDEYGLIKALGVPAGFMLIPRECFETMAPTLPIYIPKRGTAEGEEVTLFFQCALRGKSYFGEDIEFGRRATEAGVEMWIDMTIQLKHIGGKTYEHSFIEHIKNNTNPKA